MEKWQHLNSHVFTTKGAACVRGWPEVALLFWDLPLIHIHIHFKRFLKSAYCTSVSFSEWISICHLTLTGRWRTVLASSFFILEPSSGMCSILPLWVNSRCVPWGRGLMSGRVVGPTGGDTLPWSMPNGDKRWKIKPCGRGTNPKSVQQRKRFPVDRILFKSVAVNLFFRVCGCSLFTHVCTHTLVRCRAHCESHGSPARSGPRTSSTPCYVGTAWVYSHRSHHMWGWTVRWEVGGPAD